MCEQTRKSVTSDSIWGCAVERRFAPKEIPSTFSFTLIRVCPLIPPLSAFMQFR
jgi:hypothetical protein